MGAGGASAFGELLRRYRMATAHSHEELAERAGLSPRGVSDLERGARRSPRLETVRLLASALWGSALVAWHRRDLGQAAAHLQESLRLSRELGHSFYVAWSSEQRALLAEAVGQREQAAQLLGAAAALKERIGMPLQRFGQFEEAWGVAAVHARLAGPNFARAWAAGREVPEDEAVAEALALVLDVPDEDLADAADSRAAARRSAGHSLTAREVGVLRLIADGRTDRDIAEVLFVSRRTVNTHVASILNRLGVPSRAAAVARAARGGLI